MIDLTNLHERPRERCLKAGASALSLRECLALILGSGPKGLGCLGLAAEVLQRGHPALSLNEQDEIFFSAMDRQDTAYLSNIKGLGEAGTCRLLAVFEIARRFAQFRNQNHRVSIQHLTLPILTKNALSRVELKWRSQEFEWLGFVPVFESGRLGDFCVVEKGVRTHVNFDPQHLLTRLAFLRSGAFFLFHNHPSGDVTPSEDDKILTEEIRKMAKVFGLELLEHWIVSGAKQQKV